MVIEMKVGQVRSHNGRFAASGYFLHMNMVLLYYMYSGIANDRKNSTSNT